ncbi:hypothetical protein J6590_006971 [Homalodisca vitripennis]|nr:hypothetical protein J6590_006971 [Homalodisca vitripennis]
MHEVCQVTSKQPAIHARSRWSTVGHRSKLDPEPQTTARGDLVDLVAALLTCLHRGLVCSRVCEKTS